MISASPSTSLEPWLLPVSSTGSWTQNDPRYLKLWERWLSFIIIVAEALLICRHQGSRCCFSCTAKFHRNRFSCPKCQGRSFTLVSSTLPCWTIYSRWSLTVSLTTQQVELCSEGNSWSQSTRTGRISPGCWTPGHLHTWTSRWSWRATFRCLLCHSPFLSKLRPVCAKRTKTIHCVSDLQIDSFKS